MPGKRWLEWLVPLLILFTVDLPGYAGESSPVPRVIVSPGVAAESLLRNEVRAIFAMRRRTWGDGAPIKVFVLPDDHPLHRVFCKKILGVYPHQLRRIWDRNVFSGTGQAPVEVDTLEEMHRRVTSTEGAIGYLDADHVDALVKTVTVR